MARIPVFDNVNRTPEPKHPGVVGQPEPVALGPMPAYDDTPDDPPPAPPSTFFGRQDIGGNYQFAQRIDTPISETLETSFDEAWDRRSMAVSGALKDRYEAYQDKLEEATGQRLFNPYSESGYGRREILERRERGEDVDGLNQQDAAVQRFHREVAELQKRYPELAMRSHDDIVAAVQQDRLEVRRRRAEAAAGESGFLSGAAAFVGATGAAFTDPVNIITLPMGAPWSAGILRAIAIEAGIGLASESAVQSFYQTSRSQIGERADLGEAVGDVLAVGATAGVLGGAVRGVARGVELLRERRMALDHAEQIPVAERSADLDAAIAVERRALEIDEANPYGADSLGAAAHAERYAAAERAINEGKAVPRIDTDTAPAISPSDVATIKELAEVAKDPAALVARLDDLRAVPREALEQTETLADFIRREGGLSEEAAAALGIDPAEIARRLPGLVERGGKSIDDLAKRATEERFFPDRQPTPQELVQAVADEVTQGRPLRRAGAGDIPPSVAEAARTASALRRAGIDLDALAPSQIAARLRAMAETIEQTPANRSLDDAAPDARPDPEGAKLSEARNEAAQTSTAAEREAELDTIREQQVRDQFKGHEDERVMLEDEDGTIRPMSIRQILDDADREASELEALHVCVAGGAKKAAGIVGTIKKVFGQ